MRCDDNNRSRLRPKIIGILGDSSSLSLGVDRARFMVRIEAKGERKKERLKRDSRERERERVQEREREFKREREETDP